MEAQKVIGHYTFIQILSIFARVASKDIPWDIAKLCMLFYDGSFDRFDPNLISWTRMKLNKENGSIKHFADYSPGCAYLENIVESGRHHWKFKIVNATTYGGGSMHIGIWRERSDEDPPLKSIFSRYDTETLTKVGISLNAIPFADIVEMILDFNELSLRFKVNGKSYGKPHNVKKGQSRAVVQMFRNGDEIQLLGYECAVPTIVDMKRYAKRAGYVQFPSNANRAARLLNY